MSATDEMVRRAGWSQIVERRDVLAAAVAQVVQAWDGGGEDWPAGETARFNPNPAGPLPSGPPGCAPTLVTNTMILTLLGVSSGIVAGLLIAPRLIKRVGPLAVFLAAAAVSRLLRAPSCG